MYCICVFAVRHQAPRDIEIKAGKVQVVASLTPVSNCLPDLVSFNVLCYKCAFPLNRAEKMTLRGMEW